MWHHARPVDCLTFFKFMHTVACASKRHRKESWSFCWSPWVSEVRERSCGCASLWKWWWPGGRLCLADNKNEARMSRISVLKWAKSSRKSSAARRKDSFQTDMTRWHPELRDLHFLRTEISEKVLEKPQDVEAKKKPKTKKKLYELSLTV